MSALTLLLKGSKGHQTAHAVGAITCAVQLLWWRPGQTVCWRTCCEPVQTLVSPGIASPAHQRRQRFIFVHRIAAQVQGFTRSVAVDFIGLRCLAMATWWMGPEALCFWVEHLCVRSCSRAYSEEGFLTGLPTTSSYFSSYNQLVDAEIKLFFYFVIWQ